MSSSNIAALSSSYQPLIKRYLDRVDTSNNQTGDAVQQRGLVNIKVNTGPSPVSLAADVGIAPPAISGSLLNIQV